MLQRLMIVYYGEDRLPYKDENRQVHYPIVNATSGGTLITGENNTSKIYFYVNSIGGSELQWIANIKKPDGTLSYQLLTNGQFIELSNGQVDYRVELDIAGMFADQVGDVYIGIQGYGGDTVIVEDDDTYQISGDPIVLGTGAIKIKVNYSPNVLPKGETLSPTVEQLILASLGSKADKSETIFVAPNILTLNKNNFNENQMFLDQETRMFYKLVNNVFQPFQLSIADLFDAYTKAESDVLFIPQSDATVEVTSNTVVKRDNMGQIRVPTSPYENYHATSKSYVDGVVSTLKSNAFVKVDTSIYPTLADFLATNGEEGIIYLYPIDTSDLTKGYHQYIWEGNAWIDLGDTNIDLTNYVTTDTVQTITGEKTFSNGLKCGTVDLSSPNNGFQVSLNNTSLINIYTYGTYIRSNVIPIATNLDLGSSAYPWKDLYLSSTIYLPNYKITEDAGYFAIKSGANNVGLIGTSGAMFRTTMPSSNNAYDLGTSALNWKNLYLAGEVNPNTIIISNINAYLTDVDYKILNLNGIVIITFYAKATDYLPANAVLFEVSKIPSHNVNFLGRNQATGTYTSGSSQFLLNTSGQAVALASIVASNEICFTLIY